MPGMPWWSPLLACLLLALGADIARGAEGGLVAFGAARSQSARALESAWKAVPEHKRRAIERYLVLLGVSSTGTVRLVGAWQLDAALCCISSTWTCSGTDWCGQCWSTLRR